ncbi:glycosyltransferase [Bradyrhizobium lablabi]|uniref:glycosyltransferase n=1 Tax=Bradyrhizobium lablabi TaxID=722472 RepID=UPI001BA55825|nr:glycosyltransferase [Bradyrhizobium lablabi]MBR0693268.1 glycosyltransferase [Bradyrhizobium lablabi]
MKKFGIYLAYPPTLDLRAEGLGRHLAEFLKEAKNCPTAKFVIACPSWTRKSLGDLLEGVGVSPDAFEIIGPKDQPMFLKLYQLYQDYKRRTRDQSRFLRLFRVLKRRCARDLTRAEGLLVTTRSSLLLAFLALLALPFVVIAVAAMAVSWFSALFVAAWPKLRVRLIRSRLFRQYSTLVTRVATKPQASSTTVRLYRLMEEAEASLLLEDINSRKDVSAWYSPTAFWPHFNRINAPRLTCVPDVVLSESPIGFSAVGGDRVLQTFGLVEATIEGGDHFVTYSEHIKYRTLVERYQVSPSAIDVVPHGANRLDNLIAVSGFPDNEASTEAFCVNRFQGALYKAIGTQQASNFDSGDVEFIFYASQFRPNKNVMTLLRAYDHLLKRRYIAHKLVLTGDPNSLPDIARFIRDRNLQNDVLCLHDLSAQELAACYRLADLAVNPSLSEGGCPFTLTEALSVGTPVVMARIAVTEEVVTDPELQDIMLFNPYDWEDMAARIEWALQNKEELLERQRALYEQLAKRSWSTVVNEYIAILDRLSSSTSSNEHSEMTDARPG